MRGERGEPRHGLRRSGLRSPSPPQRRQESPSAPCSPGCPQGAAKGERQAAGATAGPQQVARARDERLGLPSSLGLGLELLLRSLCPQCCDWVRSVGIPLCSFQEFVRRAWGRGDFPRVPLKVLGRMLCLLISHNSREEQSWPAKFKAYI